MIKREWITKVTISFLLLFLGAFIYAIFRQDVLFCSWIPFEILARIKIDISYQDCHWIIYWVVFCLPDALWYASQIVIQTVLHKEKMTSWLLGFTLLLPFIYEIMQAINLIPGTFDWLDVFTYLLTLIVVMLCQKNYLLSYISYR